MCRRRCGGWWGTGTEPLCCSLRWAAPGVPIDALSLIPVALATAITGVFAFRVVMHWNLNHDRFREVLLRLVAEGKLDRAEKLAHAVPKAMLPPVVAELVKLARAAEAEGRTRGLLQELAPVARAGLVAAEGALRRWLLVGGLAFVSILGCAVYGLAAWGTHTPEGWMVLTLPIALLGLAGWQWRAVQLAMQHMPVDYIGPLVEAVEGRRPSAEEIVREVMG